MIDNLDISIDEIDKVLASKTLIDFTTYTMPNYEVNWHHKYLADKLTEFANGKIKKLMLSVPPQHGKSELASIRLPAFLFGLNPDLRIASCSYNDTFASKFNRKVQRLIDSEKYRDIYPNVTLNSVSSKVYEKGKYIRNSHEFEIVNQIGSYLSVGIGGGITGNPVDILIIDDPIKGREAANSKVYREKLWDWYTDEAETRLHNDSQQLIIMTRWHYDDLAGRILEEDATDWEVINIEAIKETDNDFDPRKKGEALWESKHSKKRILKKKQNRPKTFNSLYQGNPSPDEGNKFKSEWFEIINESAVPNNIKWQMYIDGAYTKNTANDPTGLMICGKSEEILYIKISIDKYLEMPELLKYVDSFSIANNFRKEYKIYIEPKASGITLRQLLNKKKYNAIDIKNKYVNKSKEERADAGLPFCESGKIKLIKGDWNHTFLEQLKRFPNDLHDEHIDLISYAIIKNFILNQRTQKRISSLSELGL